MGHCTTCPSVLTVLDHAVASVLMLVGTCHCVHACWMPVNQDTTESSRTGRFSKPRSDKEAWSGPRAQLREHAEGLASFWGP